MSGRKAQRAKHNRQSVPARNCDCTIRESVKECETDTDEAAGTPEADSVSALLKTAADAGQTILVIPAQELAPENAIAS